MINQILARQILDKIESSRKILLLPHDNPRPDGDALGAVLAMANYLKTLPKTYTAFSLYPAPESLSFLPGVETIENQLEKIEIKEYDLIILFDFGQLKNSGLEEKLRLAKDQGVTFINFDHHPDSNEVSELAIAIESASSTCEVLYHWLMQIRAEINSQMATCLLTGIVTDTQNYTNLGTTFSSLQAGSELLKEGARLQEITASTWQNKEVPTLRLWGKILQRLEENPQTGIATTIITLEDLKEENLPSEAADGVANFLNSLGQTKAIMVLKEEEGGKVKGSLRTTRDDIDVAELAKKYGGGGHRKAAGFLIEGKIVKTAEGWQVV